MGNLPIRKYNNNNAIDIRQKCWYYIIYIGNILLNIISKICLCTYLIYIGCARVVDGGDDKFPRNGFERDNFFVFCRTKYYYIDKNAFTTSSSRRAAAAAVIATVVAATRRDKNNNIIMYILVYIVILHYYVLYSATIFIIIMILVSSVAGAQ